MSRFTREVASESRSTSGLINLFKSLTGIKSLKTQNSRSQSPTPQNDSEISGLKCKTCQDPPDFKLLCEQIKIGNPIENRIAAADSLRFAVQQFPVNRLTCIFKRAKDLTDPVNPKKARTAGFKLLIACTQNSSLSDPERLTYFHVLTASKKTEDFHWQLAALIELTRHGRDLAGFHYEILPILASWLHKTWTVTSSHRKKQNGIASLNQETDLALLLVLIFDVIKFNFNISNEQTIGDLIEVVINICSRTQSSDDLRSCINIINAIITYGDIPSEKLGNCVKVLCAVYFHTVDEIRQEVWKLIKNICISHNGENTVRILFKLLHESSNGTKQRLHEICGSLLVLEKLFVKNGENGFPLVPFSFLIKSLSKVSIIDNIKIKDNILRLILSLLNGDGKELLGNVIEEDWSLMFEVIMNCAKQILDHRSCLPVKYNSEATYSICKEVDNGLHALTCSLQMLITRVQSLLVQYSETGFFHRANCVKFLVSVHQHLPETCTMLIIDIYRRDRYCFPSDLNWKDNSKTLVKFFFSNRVQSTQVRLHALEAISEVFTAVEAVNRYSDTETTNIFVNLILENVGDEDDIIILQEIMSIVINVAKETPDDEYFFRLIDIIRKRNIKDHARIPMTNDSLNKKDFSPIHGPESPVTSDNINQSLFNVVASAFVKLFILCMDKSVKKAQRLFEEILYIAKNDDYEVDARISALRFLCRLRADWANRVYLISSTESYGLAASLYRTPDSLMKRQVDTTTHQRVSRIDDLATPSLVRRSTSVGAGHTLAKRSNCVHCGKPQTLQKINHLWMEPDLGPFPHLTPGKISPVLFSILNTEFEQPEISKNLNPLTCEEKSSKIVMDQLDNPSEEQAATLNVPQYVEILTQLISKSCDWEILSYIIVHLPSQLMNHALFMAAIPQIRTLREVLCDHIKNNRISDPPISSGLRKSDVSICLFQILNVVMSYHKHFSKNEEDEIVRTFVHGVGEKTSKCCVHALSICCHELPGSTSKMLATILTKMSQIITQSHVAIHILEFLACLARLPELYVNFREEEYRIVFAICFRYLQYVRDQKKKEVSIRNSSTSVRGVTDGLLSPPVTNSTEKNLYPATSDDLPEYVYELAYNVIIFWFLSLKLVDRASQVRWIIKNLISSDIDRLEAIDEQALVTLDFMQRVTYTDVDESGSDPSFKKEVYGEINRKRWIIGDTLITIEQATRGDWAQITKHQPSGTSSYVIQEKFGRPPHQVQNSTDTSKDVRYSLENFKLPSHLLLQLCASTPISGESVRPIPLLDCKSVDRAVSNLNRIYTVDSHKVGVIYIGENQTNEAEILSNVHGSSDYIEFLFGLGTLTRLRDANFNTQGLDRQADSDGEYTFCWRDRVSEIIFHVTTQMPTDLDNDPQCSNKKRHIGNDFVNIIFNNSGLPFNFNTFPSAFNFVNIVIIPESKLTFVARRLRSKFDDSFYKVQVMSKPGFPEISPAAETKILSLSTLSGFIRLLSLNASVFSLVWAQRAGGEHFSPWRSRLREIRKIRDVFGLKVLNVLPRGTSHGNFADSKNVRDSMNSIRRSSINMISQTTESVTQNSLDSTRSEMEVRSDNFEETLLEFLDFSKWV